MLACQIDGLRSKPKGTCLPTSIVGSEVWYDVPNYPRYTVSTMGNIKRKAYIDVLGRQYKEILVKGRISSRIGARVVMCNQDGCRDYVLARVIATTIYDYPLDTPLTVNHMDGNRDNNNIGNLELVTREENTRHAHRYRLAIGQYIKTVLKDTHTGNMYIFDTQTQASKFLGRNVSFIANAKRDQRYDYGRYRLVV